jgi:NAD+ diphosphatase
VNGPPLAGSGVDRAAHRRVDPDWLETAWRRARVLVVSATGQARCTFPNPSGRPALVLVPPEAAPEGERLFLGVDEHDTAYFAVIADLPAAGDARAVTLRQVGAVLGDRDRDLFVTTVALANWHTNYRYAPGTGEPTLVTGGGWLRVDGAGGQVFPRTDPAIIVLVHDGVAGPDGHCLLGSNAARPVGRDGRRFFSTLAGFVEPGESAEATVVREVFEEVGVRVSRLRYEGSQAWPFPSSLMLGFSAQADPAQPLRPDQSEIAEARWFTRAEIAPLLVDRPDPSGAPYAEPVPGAPITLPGPASIAHYLIRTWLYR